MLLDTGCRLLAGIALIRDIEGLSISRPLFRWLKPTAKDNASINDILNRRAWGLMNLPRLLY